MTNNKQTSDHGVSEITNDVGPQAPLINDSYRFFGATLCSAAHPRVRVNGLRNNDVTQNGDSVGLIAVCNLVCNLLTVSQRTITVQCPADYGWLLCFRDSLIVG